MTVMTKPSMMLSKAVYIKPLSPLLDNDPNDKHTCVEEKVEIYSDSQKEPKEISVCWGMLTVLILFFCVVGAMMLYGHIMFKVNWFEGNRCTVPIIQEYSHHLRLIRFDNDSDVPTSSKDAAQEMIDAIEEELSIGATMEKITVSNFGHNFDVIHDFNENATGIIDKERCFVMELNSEVVSPPDAFILTLQQNANFDVSSMRGDMTAVFPVEDFSRFTRDMITKCNPRPLYHLQHQSGSVIRKRETEEPAHDYVHFSGNYVFEIKISNMAEILLHEKTVKQK